MNVAPLAGAVMLAVGGTFADGFTVIADDRRRGDAARSCPWRARSGCRRSPETFCPRETVPRGGVVPDLRRALEELDQCNRAVGVRRGGGQRHRCGCREGCSARWARQRNGRRRVGCATEEKPWITPLSRQRS